MRSDANPRIGTLCDHPKGPSPRIGSPIAMADGFAKVAECGMLRAVHRLVWEGEMGSIEIKDIIIWVVIGLIAGWLASFIVGGSSIVTYILSGLLGSIVGGILVRVTGIKLNLGNAVVDQIVVSAIGAIIVVIVARVLA